MKHLLASALLVVLFGATVGGPTAPNGTEINCDLPKELQVRNRGGSDGAGLCVFASLKHSSLWQNIDATRNIFEWMFTHPGGGYPEKVDQVIAQICKEKGCPRPDYIQVQGKDLAILKLASKTGRMPAVTYSVSPSGRYGGHYIAHMVSLPHAQDGPSGGLYGVLDNNFPGTIEWMTEPEFSRAYLGREGAGWAVIFLDEGPPPPPCN